MKGVPSTATLSLRYKYTRISRKKHDSKQKKHPREKKRNKKKNEEEKR